MATYQIKKGRDLPLKGRAETKIVELPMPSSVAVQPPDFKGFKPRLAVHVGDHVKAGNPVLTDKTHPEVRITAPVSGEIKDIRRGAKRVLLEVVIRPDADQQFEIFDKAALTSNNREAVQKTLLQSGLWPAIRQRPFSKIATPGDVPKSIFIHAMSTEPLAVDMDAVLDGKEVLFQKGLDVLKTLTDNSVHLCYRQGASAKTLTEAKNVEHHQFRGPHPAGNVGTHIHAVDPIKKGDVVWFVEAQDVVRIGHLAETGKYSAERCVAVTGEAAVKRHIAKTVIGAPLSVLFDGTDLSGLRCLSGGVLTGKSMGAAGFLRYYDSQVTAIPEVNQRRLLGWLTPGFDRFSLTRTYASAFTSREAFSFDTDINGGERAIVLNHIYDQYNALDILTYFLIKAVVGGDIEEAERLGLLECDEEDFALATFACPSKVDVGGLIQSCLDIVEREG